jgi:hypothetical protein
MTLRGWLGGFLCLNLLMGSGVSLYQSLVAYHSGPGTSNSIQQDIQSGLFVLVVLAVVLAMGFGSVLWGRSAWRRKELTRREIQLARERGLWPPLGEQPSLEHVKRMIQAGETIMAIKLYRQIHGMSFADAKAAVDNLAG